MLFLFLFLAFGAVSHAQVGGLGKSSYSTNRILRYSSDVSTSLSQAQNDLQQATMRISRGGMIGAPEVVRLNMNLMKAIKAKKSLDVGLFTGFSSLGMALSMPPDGKVVGMDITRNFYNQVNGSRFWNYPGANVANKLDLVIAPAKDTMDNLMAAGGNGTYDFCFIDADKNGYPNYYEQCLALLRPGGIMTIDNSLWGGSVAWPSRRGTLVKLLDDLNRKIGTDPRVFASLLPIADGLWVIHKN